MNNQNLIIYDFQILFNILEEIEENLNFKLLNISKNDFSKIKLKKSTNYIIISKKKINNLENQVLFNIYPLKITKLIETININFLKNKFNKQSEIDIGLYKINLNSRKMFSNERTLDLTEKEADIILFLKNSTKPVTISELQSKVWGYNSRLDTHTVETHIYRLRKKISNKFNNDKFIISSKLGYNIK
tara:strand:+ start:7343 stop:7906 length:564 start_codon:yes stop_codon:yes gene_type:complete